MTAQYWLFALILGAVFGGVFEHVGALFGMGLGISIALALNLQRALREEKAARQQLEKRLQAVEHALIVLRASAVSAPLVSEAELVPAPAPLPAEVATHEEVAQTAADPEPIAAPPFPAQLQPEPPPPFAPPAWWTRIMAGNPLAKVGVVLLFFGVASALRLAAEYGLMPIGLRLVIAAAAGLGLVAFGVLQVRRSQNGGQRRTFGLAIQGGGFALLYLVAYFMLQRYAMIGPGLAFTLFAALGVLCVALAARQDGPALAVLGLSGAFIAPLMAGGRSDSPLGLFSYFALLNVFILTVDWFRAWRVLNIAGFLFTLVIGMAWGMDAYQPQHYLVTQLFLAGFLLLYSAMPVATALWRAPGADAWREGILLFGTPLAGTALQAALVRDTPYGLAWSALLASVYYAALWFLLWRQRQNPGPNPAQSGHPIIERATLGLAITFLTVAVPLAFEAQVTSAFWAAEGAAVVWFGVRSGRRLAQACGLLMQLLAGAALLYGWDQLGHRLPVANDRVLGALLLAAAGVASARLLRSLDGGPRDVPPALPFVWAMVWWLGTGLLEIDHFAAADWRAPLALLWVTLTVLGQEGLSVAWRWPQVRAAAVLLPLTLWCAVLLTWDRAGHPLAGLNGLAFLAGAAAHLWLLARHEKATEFTPPLLTLRHVAGWWCLLLALPAELAWQARALASPAGQQLWPTVIWLLALATALGATVLGLRRQLWPFASPAGAYAGIGLLPPMAGLILVMLGANLHLSGAGSGLPWLPLLNVLDLALLAGLLALYACRSLPALAQGLPLLVAALAFVSLSAEAARLAHHWGDIAWASGPIWQSRLFQALLTLIWTTLAIAVMIAAAKTRPEQQRPQWFAGFGLLAVVGVKLLLVDAAGRGTLMWTGTLLGVALLVLAASYFAPLPPKTGSAAASDGDRA